MAPNSDSARAAFDASTDFTVGIEEEFALLDAGDLGLTSRFEELREAAAADPVLCDSVAGELISSEIEIRSGRGEDLAAAITAQRNRRRRARWAAIAAARSSPRPERISISDAISSPATESHSTGSSAAASRSSSNRAVRPRSTASSSANSSSMPTVKSVDASKAARALSESGATSLA